ncbi:sec-independent protein translocase protein TatA [Rhodoligotrophos appendicifer]|uniref:twin-arginine translocase TatA/TatE family subunit n=1 Tax=Rhodoligotrophos appendicifer TaxID=987056 RepID=UPI00117E6DC2|nr:twin-arginine translocase TatA/TatE family subunit [Rhodoligotrophos appendicifer]
MGAMSAWHWIILGLVVVLLFGRGKVSELMGDVAKGIKSFKKGMAEEDERPIDPNASRIEHGTDERAGVTADGVKTPIRE